MKRFKSLKDHVYDYIETQIKEGKLSPNQRINEAVICKELNICFSALTPTASYKAVFFKSRFTIR